MDYIDHNGVRREETGSQDRLLHRLYTTQIGRLLLKPLIQPGVSRMAGSFLDSSFSRCLIAPFIRANHLDMAPYQRRNAKEFVSYNDFFTREIRPEMRPIDMNPEHLPSPCDGKALVCPIGKHTGFQIKNARYTVSSLLRNEKLAARFEGGYAVILRLGVTDYHRYAYALSGRKSENVHIPGIFHTVNPIAVELADVFKENTREYTLIQNPEFGTLLQMEVGALMVGRICNESGAGTVQRGMEKGHFEFGGSTIILLLQKDRVQIREDLLKNTLDGCETEVRLGEKIGCCIRN
ncbi:MAG: phosphatidylserine decarboxylase [Lachnospiraceae bacterium]|nr:phosphatidylserine decarboxylase [Lachnospiraceae bacterium]